MKINKLTFILLVIALESCRQERKAELSFDKCKVSYTLFPHGQKELYAGHYITNEMEIKAATQKLALCLCDRYIETKDTIIKAKILEIFKSNENYNAEL